jgi:hypothetical protein
MTDKFADLRREYQETFKVCNGARERLRLIEGKYGTALRIDAHDQLGRTIVVEDRDATIVDLCVNVGGPNDLYLTPQVTFTTKTGSKVTNSISTQRFDPATREWVSQ